jgi:hypothetical protein
MPGLPGFVTTNVKAYTRLRGPALAGQIADGGASGGPLPAAGGFICVQSTASITNQVITTSDNVVGRSSFVYIPVIATTGSLAGAAAPAYVGAGTPLVWNDNAGFLMVYSSSRASWMTMVITTSMQPYGFTTSQ